MTVKLFVSLSAMLFAVSSANAAVVTYSDKSLFLSETSATSLTGPLPELGNVGLTPTTVGGATFSLPGGAVSLIIGGISSTPDWTPLNPGADIAISGDEDLNIDLATPSYSFGFDFVEPSSGPPGICGFGCTDSTFLVRLLSGSTLVDSFTFNAPDDTLAFVGGWSDQLFNRVEIQEIGGNIDDEYYGEFYAGSLAPVSVPLPGALALLGIGLIGFGLRRRAA